ncbi:MAG: hypothetical protein IJZ72_02980 [Oscillospiraceae bacterium]|nr:hypothetical protein [Oscillospiraceae bacterium]
MNKFIKLTLIILWSLIFYIFDAPSGMRFFSVPSLEMLPYILLNFSGYGVLFLICFGFERSELKKTAAAFAVTLPFKFAIDMLLPLMSEKMALEAWAQDIAFLMQAAVIVAVTTAVKKSRPSVKKLVFAAVGAVLIIVSGLVGGGVLNEVAYKYAISADSPYAKNLVYYVNGVKEIYALAVFAARCLIAVGISADISEKYSFSFKWTGAAAAVYLAFNCIFNTANIFSGINTGYAASDKADGAISVEQSFFELYRGSGDTRYSCCLSVKNHVFVGDKGVTKYNTNPLAACGWNIDFTDPDGKSFACQTEKLVYLKDNKWC